MLLPDGEIGTLVQLWEHDAGDPDEAKAAVAAAFAAAAGVLAASGVAAWVAAVVSGVGAVVQWLLGFLDDDHIGDQAFVFTRQTILDQAGKVGQSFEVSRQLTDGDGDYTVSITVTHVGPPPVTTTVPEVREAQRGAAISAVLSVGLVPHATGSNASNAWVFSQSPSAGTVVDRGSTVNLRLRTGPLP
jgi:PASTA domain